MDYYGRCEGCIEPIEFKCYSPDGDLYYCYQCYITDTEMGITSKMLYDEREELRQAYCFITKIFLSKYLINDLIGIVNEYAWEKPPEIFSYDEWEECECEKKDGIINILVKLMTKPFEGFKKLEAYVTFF